MNRWFILLLLCSPWMMTGHSFPHEQQTTVIKIGAIFALNEGANTGNVERVSALQMVIDQVNANSSILPTHTLHLEVRDSRSSIEVGVSMAQELIDDGVVAIIGPSTSTVSEAVASGPANEAQIPLISPSAIAALLSDKQTYPTFVRTAIPDFYQSQALIDLLVYFDWSVVTSLSTTDIYGQGNINPISSNSSSVSIGIPSFEDSATDTDIEIVQQENIEPGQADVTRELQRIKDANSYIIVVNLIARDAQNVFEQAAELQLTSEEGYVWVGTDGVSQNELVADNEVVRDVLQGMIGIAPQLGQDRLPWFLDLWETCAGEDTTTYPGCGDRSPNIYVP